MNKEKLAKKYKRIFKEEFKKISELPIKVKVYTTTRHGYCSKILCHRCIFVVKCADITRQFNMIDYVGLASYGYKTHDQVKGLVKRAAFEFESFIRKDIVKMYEKIFSDEFEKHTDIVPEVVVKDLISTPNLLLSFCCKTNLDKRNFEWNGLVFVKRGWKGEDIREQTERLAVSSAARYHEKKLDFTRDTIRDPISFPDKEQIGEFIYGKSATMTIVTDVSK